MTVTIRINGEDRMAAAGTVADLLRRLEIDPARKGIAVALNDRVVARARWAVTAVADGDRLEIIRAVAGG